MVWPALIGAGLSIAGLAQQHQSRQEAIDAAKEESGWNAEMAQQDIKVVQTQANLEQANIRRGFAAHSATMQARGAASGARVGVGSGALALVQNARAMAEQEVIAQMEAESDIGRLEAGSTMQEISSIRSARTQEQAMVGDVIQTGSQIAGMYI